MVSFSTFKNQGKELLAPARLLRTVITTALVAMLLVTVVFTPEPVKAGTGGRFTFRRDDNSLWGTDFYGAGLGEMPFVIDTNADGKQELAVYYNNRITVRDDNGGYWGLNFFGAGMGETPIAIDDNPLTSQQKFAMYYQGKFTKWNGNGYGTTVFPGAGRLDLPLAVDTDGNGVQEYAVYRNGRFTFLRPDGSIWGITFSGATAQDIPFVIDTNGDKKQELAVYRNGRVTVRNDDGSYWGFNFPGASWDDLPLAVDTNGDRRQEFAMYNHVSNQLSAKQVLGFYDSGRVTFNEATDCTSCDIGDRSLARLELEDIADGNTANLSTRCSYAGSLPRAITPDATFMRFLVDAGGASPLRINSLFGQCHSSAASMHHKGKAVDLNCVLPSVTPVDQVGGKYGVRRNGETCAANAHWHYSVGGV